MADLREDFVQYVVKALVSNPDAVSLKRASDERGDYLELTVDPADMGKVIGKAGATAKSLRTLLRGVGAKDDLSPLPLKIVDPEGDRHHAPAGDAPAAAAAADDGAAADAPATDAPADDVPADDAAADDAAPAEESAGEAAAPAADGDEHQELHDRTRNEMEELADLEL